MELQMHYRQAAARQSWHRDSMRNLLIALVDQFPKATDADLLWRFTEKMREEDEYLLAAAEYAVMQTLSTLQRRTEKKSQTKAARQQAETEVKAKVQSIKDQIMLLNLPMPNGKLMRNCTGAEMGEFGAGYQRIARKVGKTARVGEKLNEEQLRKLMGP